MRLGISTYSFGWAAGAPGYAPPAKPLTLEGLISKAAQLGVHVVQIADNARLPRMSDAELAALHEAASRSGIAFELGTRGINPEHLRMYLSLALRLQATLVRVIIETENPNATASEIALTLRIVAPEYERAGVHLALENHDLFPAVGLAEMIERIDSPNVGICLDTVNSLGCAEGLDTLLRVLGRWVINLHVKDFQIRRPAHRGGFIVEGRPAGQGQLDIPWLLGELRGHGSDPNAILELWTPPAATITESIAIEETWVTQSIDYLRQFIGD